MNKIYNRYFRKPHRTSW